MKILFVCTGNTCRSSMARALAARRLEKAGLKTVEVLSAGTGTVSGLPASHKAVEAMKELGLDISGHRTNALDRDMVEGADLVLTMTAAHSAEVLAISPDASGKVYTLAQYAGLNGDVADPFGGGIEAYRRTADQLAGIVSLVVDRLVKEMKDSACCQETGDRRQETGDV